MLLRSVSGSTTEIQVDNVTRSGSATTGTGESLSFTDFVNLKHNTEYCYRVRALNSYGSKDSSKGGDFGVYMARGGNSLLLSVDDAAAGGQDSLKLGYDAGRLASFTYKATGKETKLQPKVGMTLGQQQRAVFTWQDLSLLQGDAIEVKALNSQQGVEYRSLSGKALRHSLVLEYVDGATEQNATAVFGPFEAPSGAIQRVSIAGTEGGVQLRVETDTNGDGTLEQSSLIAGQTCTPKDVDGDGIADVCEPTL